MISLEKYKAYREAARKLVAKVMKDSLSRDVMTKSARLLGIAQGDVLVFDDEQEMHILMDFALHDCRVNNKTVMAIYREKVSEETETERELLEAFLASKTSLYKIISISPAEPTLLIEDLLAKGNKIELSDLNFSRTAVPGLLLFMRLVPFKDFNMTSGVSFVFPADSERYLLKRYKTLAKKGKYDSEAMERFIIFFRLNQTDGMQVRYE